MTDTNNVVLVGRLTRDLNDEEFGYTNGGIARAKISIAVNRSVKRNEQWTDEVSYFDITLWGKTAENLRPYLLKGKQIAVTGALKQERWEKNGQKFSKVVVIAENVQLLGNKNENSGSNFTGSSNGGYSNNVAKFVPKNNFTQPQQNNNYKEDIPF